MKLGKYPIQPLNTQFLSDFVCDSDLSAKKPPPKNKRSSIMCLIRLILNFIINSVVSDRVGFSGCIPQNPFYLPGVAG